MNTLTRHIKSGVKAALRTFGYRLQNLSEVQPIDVRADGNDPRALLYRGTRQPVLIDVPLAAGRGLPLFSFGSPDRHPFARAVSAAMANPADERGAIKSVLQKYYELVQPQSAVELYGLSREEAPGLAEEPPWAAMLPWDEETIDDWRKNHQDTVQMENRQAGRALPLSHGWAWCGPTTPDKLQIETARLHCLMTSIRDRGLRRHDGFDGDILGMILMPGDGSWQWQARGGQHRAAVASALELTTVPIRVIKIVRREEVDVWPNVVSGVFTRDGALRLFDRIVDGALPTIAQPWMDTLCRPVEV